MGGAVFANFNDLTADIGLARAAMVMMLGYTDGRAPGGAGRRP